MKFVSFDIYPKCLGESCCGCGGGGEQACGREAERVSGLACGKVVDSQFSGFSPQAFKGSL